MVSRFRFYLRGKVLFLRFTIHSRKCVTRYHQRRKQIWKLSGNVYGRFIGLGCGEHLWRNTVSRLTISAGWILLAALFRYVIDQQYILHYCDPTLTSRFITCSRCISFFNIYACIRACLFVCSVVYFAKRRFHWNVTLLSKNDSAKNLRSWRVWSTCALFCLFRNNNANNSVMLFKVLLWENINTHNFQFQSPYVVTVNYVWKYSKMSIIRINWDTTVRLTDLPSLHVL